MASETRAVMDFDALWEERKRERIPFKAFGRVWHLPPAPPVSVLLKAVKLESAGRGQAGPADLLEIATDLFGAEQFNKMVRLGLTTEQLESLIRWAMGAYRGREADNEGDLESSKG